MNIKIKNSIPIIGMIGILCIGLASCKNKTVPKGFTLQRFEIINTQLDSVIHGLKDSIYIKEALLEDDNVMIMHLRVFNSNTDFGFTTSNKEDISRLFISDDLRRIVGYIENGDIDLIILSEERNKYRFEWEFYKFLIPTKEKKYFDYIYFPDDMYSIDDRGIPPPPPLFDPYYYNWVFKNGNIIPINYGSVNLDILTQIKTKS